VRVRSGGTDPVVEMGLGNRRSVTSCFCNAGCPAGTFPHRQYWVIATGFNVPDTDGEHWLMRFVPNPSPDLCEWQAVESHGFPPKLATLRKNVNFGPGGPTGYTWEFTIFEPPFAIGIWELTLPNTDPEGGLVQPEADNSCSRQSFSLPQGGFLPSFPAVLTPAFPEACIDADWPEKEQRKPYAPF